MTQISSFKDLVVWQRSMEVAEMVYSIASKLPPQEIYGLGSQIRRSAISIPSNIAEGHKRGTKDFVRFLKIAYGSAAELETQIILSERLYSHISCSVVLAKTIEIQKMLSVIIKKLNGNGQ